MKNFFNLVELKYKIKLFNFNIRGIYIILYTYKNNFNFYLCF